MTMITHTQISLYITISNITDNNNLGIRLKPTQMSILVNLKVFKFFLNKEMFPFNQLTIIK